MIRSDKGECKACLFRGTSLDADVKWELNGRSIVPVVSYAARDLHGGRCLRGFAANATQFNTAGSVCATEKRPGPHQDVYGESMQKVDSLPENNQRTRHLSFEEEDRLFAKLTGEREYLISLVTVAIYAGPRRGELLKLRWSNVGLLALIRILCLACHRSGI